MQYVRIIVAVEDPTDLEWVEALEEFIEGDDHIQGAHVSGSYPTREAALEGPWVPQPEWVVHQGQHGRFCNECAATIRNRWEK